MLFVYIIVFCVLFYGAALWVSTKYSINHNNNNLTAKYDDFKDDSQVSTRKKRLVKRGFQLNVMQASYATQLRKQDNCI